MKFKKLTSNETLKLTNKLTTELNQRKKVTKQEFISQGYLKSTERLTYENIEMSDLEIDLLQVLYSYHSSGQNKFYSLEQSKIESICLAAMCHFIKSEHHIRAYTKDYEVLTGLKVDGRLYRILENGFKKEGILPKNWDKMKGFRYKDTLINETGIPKYLANDILDLFKIYWKNLRQFEFKYVYENIDRILNRRYIWDIKEISRLQESYDKLSDYPRKVNTVIMQLTDVCTLLEEGNYYEEDLEKDHIIRSINKVLKFDIFRILPRKESLKALYIQILSKVSVNKFNYILQNVPSNVVMHIPSGSRRSSLKYSDIQLGVYNINSPIYRVYTVLPHTSLSINRLLEFKKNQFTKVKESYVGYRSDKPYTVEIGKYKKESSYPLYDNNRIKGHYWYGKIPNAMPLSINNNIYEPTDFVDYSPVFKYCYNDSVSYTYNLSLNNFRVYLPSYSNEKVEVKCNYSDESKYLNIDEEGYIEIKRLAFNLNKIIGQNPVSIEMNHIMDHKNDLLYKQSIERLDDINLYVKNLKKNNFSKTSFEYNLKDRDWSFNNKIIFHIEQVGNNTNKVITNINNTIQDIEVLTNYNNKYNQFLLEDIIIKEDKNILICNEKLREKIGIEGSLGAKINLKFIYNYEKIFDTDLIILDKLETKLDSKVYIDGDIVDISIKYKDMIYNEKSEINISRIKNTLVSRLIPVSIYIDEIDSYYTEYIKPEILGYLILDKETDEVLEVDKINFDEIDRYKIKIQSLMNEKFEIFINNNKIDEYLENDMIIDLKKYKNLFNRSNNIISVRQCDKIRNIFIIRNIKQGIFTRPDENLKWYEIDEIYTKEKLNEDIGKLGQIFKVL